jgi:hypothetical protein
MGCEQYNIIKEGDLRNLPDSSVVRLSNEQLNSLYDGDASSSSVTLSGVGAVSLGVQVLFGEAYELCYVDYYTDDPIVTNFSLFYGTASGTSQVSFVNVSGNQYRATLNDYARVLDIKHTVSGTAAEVFQLEVAGTRNETLGFGAAKASEIDYLNLESSSSGSLSRHNVVQLFNDIGYDQTAKISVVPTGTKADDYIHIGTSSSGTFYGIDDFGFSQPAPNPITLIDDDLLSNTLGEQWERVLSGQAHNVTPTTEGLIFDIQYDTARISVDSSSLQTIGLLTKEFFTSQSFTAEFEINFEELSNTTAFDSVGREWFFVFTNSYPIPDVGY